MHWRSRSHALSVRRTHHSDPMLATASLQQSSFYGLVSFDVRPKATAKTFCAGKHGLSISLGNLLVNNQRRRPKALESGRCSTNSCGHRLL